MRFLAMACTALCFATAASAEDWSGIYIGGHIGGAATSVDYNHVETNGIGGDEETREFFSTTSRDVTGGLQLGVQQQFGNVVAGVEVGYSFLDSEDAAVTDLDGFPRKRVTNIGGIWTVAGRLGYATGAWLGYAKAGYARASLGFDNILIADGEVLGASSKKVGGWLIGGGFEYALSPAFSIGTDYTYINLNAGNQQQFDGDGAVAAFNDKIDASVHQVTVRGNYRFNWGNEREHQSWK